VQARKYELLINIIQSCPGEPITRQAWSAGFKGKNVNNDCPLLHVLKDYPKEVILRDGSGVTLRPLFKKDGPLLSSMLNRLPEEDRWFLGLAEGVHELTKRWVSDADSVRVISIAAVLEGDMIAVATLIRHRPGAEGHVGRIQMTVAPEYRDRRLGTWMLLDLINAAMSMGLERLVMYLVEGRDSVIMRGLEKIQFAKEAVLPLFVKDLQGRFYDVALMIKRLPGEWTET
jgi:hypothetical protein